MGKGYWMGASLVVGCVHVCLPDTRFDRVRLLENKRCLWADFKEAEWKLMFIVLSDRRRFSIF